MKNHYTKGALFGLSLAVVLAGCASPTTVATITNTPQPLPTDTPTSTPKYERTYPIDDGVSMDGYVDIAPDEWTVFNQENIGFKIGMIMDIAIGEDGAVWMASSPGGLIKYQNGTWQQFKPDKDFSLNQITLTKENIVWVVVANIVWVNDLEHEDSYEIARFDGKTWAYYPVPLSESKLSNSKWEYLFTYLPPTITSDGKVWVSSNENIYSFDGKKWTVFKDLWGYLTESPSKELWLRDNDRLWRFNGSKWEATKYVEPRGEYQMSQCRPLWLNFAQNGTMWLMANDYYIRILPTFERQAYLPRYLSGCWTVNDIAVSPNSDLWLVGWDHIFVHFTNEKWIKLNVKEPLNTLLSVAEAPNGDVWIGGAAGVIYLYHQKH